MPIYKISELAEKRGELSSSVARTVVGELMKVGIVTYQKGEGSPPHFHPNEEQFVLMLEGRRYNIVGDEERIVGPGDLIHIPRNTRHGARTLDEKAVFLAVKSPVGDGSLTQDYNKAEDADEVIERLNEKLKKDA
ncbi:cupin domain-containing protein [Nitrospinota bacterium]